MTPTQPERIQRYTQSERLTHWAVAAGYVALFLSGLALFHPFFYALSALFGGGALMRVLHPFIGVAFAIVFGAYALPLRAENRLLPSDRVWLRGMLRYMNRTGEDVPVEGKFNGGQKVMYWSMVLVIVVLLVT